MPWRVHDFLPDERKWNEGSVVEETWVVINVIYVSTSRVYGTLIDVYQRHPTIANANPPHSTLSRPTPGPPRLAGLGAGASAYLMDADRRRVCTGR